MSTESKPCRECGIEKPFSEFAKDAQLADGLGRVCRACKKRYTDEYRRKKKAERIPCSERDLLYESFVLQMKNKRVNWEDIEAV